MKDNIQKVEPTIKPPKLVKRKLIEGLPGGSIVNREQYRSFLLSSMDLSNQSATHVSFEEVLFSQVNMANTQLEELRLEDVRLSECDLITANWYKAGFYRTELIGCRMTGFLAAEAHFQDVL
ncbi:MAG TPA: pentapeptide repeat-containing protein, partial [Ktedonobacteraceae bacterium]|nr:pentapeptide repeat-containing protein [Ktedonobacteraceae bacterium]